MIRVAQLCILRRSHVYFKNQNCVVCDNRNVNGAQSKLIVPIAASLTHSSFISFADYSTNFTGPLMLLREGGAEFTHFYYIALLDHLIKDPDI